MKRSTWVTVYTVVMLALASDAQAKPLTGMAQAIDGDTIVMQGRHIRLFGMDAFEHDQMCGRFACGRQATVAMRGLISGQVVTCDPQDIDPYGRTVAICKLRDGRDLGAEMVRQGLAVDYRHFSRRYMAQEQQAKATRAGAWAYGFDSPESFRRQQR